METVLNEQLLFRASAEFVQRSRIADMSTYQALCQEAQRDPEAFWGRLAREQIYWHKPFTQVLEQTHAPFYKWFDDGLTNVSYNCLDRHLERGFGKKTAFIFEADDGQITTIDYQALHQRVCKLANALKARGIHKGDRVIIYIGMRR